MGKIIKNGVVYGSGLVYQSAHASNTPFDNRETIFKSETVQGVLKEISDIGIGADNEVELTQAEYDALPDSKYNDNVNYFITDLDDENDYVARSIRYDNSSSRLKAKNTQDAIDELDNAINVLEQNAAMLEIQLSTDKFLKHTSAGDGNIEYIGGNSVQHEYTGKNWLYSEIPDYITTELEIKRLIDRCIEVRGTAVEDIKYEVGQLTPVKSGDKFIFSGCNGGSETTYYLSLELYNNSTKVTQVNQYSGEINITIPEGINNIAAYFIMKKGFAMYGGLHFPMLRPFGTDNNYEPYCGKSIAPNPDFKQEITDSVVNEIRSCGKNIFPIGTIEITDRSYGVNVNYPPGTYTLSVLPVSTDMDDDVSCVYFYNITEAGVLIELKRLDFLRGVRNGLPITTNKPIKKIVFYAGLTHISSEGDTAIYSDIQLEVGPNMSLYEPYTEHAITLSKPVNIRGIKSIQDLIVKRDNVWGVMRNIKDKKITSMASSYNNDKLPTNDTCVIFYNGDFTDRMASIDQTIGMSNMFAFMPGLDLTYEHCYFNPSIVSKNYLYMVIRKDRLSYTSETYDNLTNAVNNWLSNNEFIVRYVTSESEFEPLPLKDQISLNTLKVFDTMTYVTTDGDVSATVAVEFGMSKIGAYALSTKTAIDDVITSLTVDTITLESETTKEQFIQLLREYFTNRTRGTLRVNGEFNTIVFGQYGNFLVDIISNMGNYTFIAINHWNGNAFTGSFTSYSEDYAILKIAYSTE